MPKPFRILASEPRVIRRPDGRSFVAGLGSIDVECQECRHRWLSHASQTTLGGAFVERHASVDLVCPMCGAVGTAPM